MIIDAHVNITHDGRWLNTIFDASLERLLDEMAQAGIDRCLLVSMPGATTNRFIASVVERHPEKFRGVGHLDFTGDLSTQITEISAMGLSGVKIHPRLQKIDLTGPGCDALWKRLSAARATLLVDGYLQTAPDSVPIGNLTPLAYEERIRAFPDVNMVLAHAGAHRVLDTYFLCRSYANAWCDLSYSLSVLKQTSVNRDYAFLAERADRKTLFGSDFPEMSLPVALADFRALASELLPEKKENILSRNALRLYWKEAAA